jgi:2,4-dienoyl-CoA reductase-like NADH-dependent reductase (Old Yellow Enzyme family)
MTQTQYPNLFSEWQIRNTRIKNRVVFPPTCPTWVSDPSNGIFTDMATDYYEERARGGVGLIIIGAAHVHPSSQARKV